MHPTHHCCNTPNCTAGAGAACRPTGQRAGAWQVALATRLVALVTPLVALATALAATLAGAQPAAVQINSASNAGSSTPAAGASQVAEARLRIVGSLAGLNPYTKHEAPFWTITLPALTANRVQAEIVPYDRAGIRGQDMLRLIKLGVVPFGTVPLSLSATDDVLIGAPDLAGLNPDLAALRRTAAAFRPVLAQHLRQQHGAELLMVYPYPAQVLFCKTAFSVLADLAGRRVRVSSATQADLVDALGGLPVYTGFADLLPQMRAGALDCAITGTMSGYTVGLAGATSHLHSLAISWGVQLFAANSTAWTALSPALRQLLQARLPLLEQALWAEADRETGDGIACSSGAKACAGGPRGAMQVVQPGPADQQRLRSLVASTVLPRWLARCGPGCAQVWNTTLAPVVGIQATP